MSLNSLLVLLPDADGVTSLPYVQTADGRTPALQGQAPRERLPAASRGAEVVAVVPATRLSWHRVELPRGVGPGSARLRAVLDSLLEDRLLDDTAALHLALGPGTGSGGGPAWVAACDRAWLRRELEQLDGAGHEVTRVVPEAAPSDGPLRLIALACASGPRLVVSGAAIGGQVVLPLDGSVADLLPAAGPDAGDGPEAVWAEPALAAEAERGLARPVQLQTPAERLLAAAQGEWNLAQFDLDRSGQTRGARRIAGWVRQFALGRDWAPARWGLALALIVQLVGLNAWAWREQQAQKTQRDAIRAVLTQTFPQVKLVVDAPTQMQREVERLRQTAGTLTGRDAEALLSALGEVLPPDRAPRALSYAPGELKVQGLVLGEAEMPAVSQRLQGKGYDVQPQGETLQIRWEGGS